MNLIQADEPSGIKDQNFTPAVLGKELVNQHSLQSGVNDWLATLENKALLQFVVVAGITLFALLMRLYKLPEWSFWADEMSMIRKAQELSHPALSLPLMHLVLKTLGVNEWSARIVPALIGTISLPILYLPVRKLVGPGVALITILLLAVSPWHLYWSQNARYYTTLLLFYTLSLLFFYIGIEKNRAGWLLLSVAFLGVAFFERYIALILVPIAAGYLILVKVLPLEKPAGLNWKNIIILLIPFALGGLVVLPKFIFDMTNFVGSYTDLAKNDVFWILGGSIYYIGVPTVIVGLLGLATLFMQNKRLFIYLGLGLVGPVAATLLFSLFTYTANRYIFISLVCWLILAGIGIMELLRGTHGYARLLSLGLLFVLVLTPMGDNLLYYQYQHGNRADWKAGTEFLQNRKESGDLLVTSDAHITRYYLPGEKMVTFKKVDLAEIESGDNKVWFIEDNVGVAYWPAVHRWIVKNATLAGVFDVHVEARVFQMRVYLYDPQ